MRILFVENHEVFAKTVTAEFLGAHDVVRVGSVREALGQLASASFDALLVDYDLDDGKGYEVVRVARARHPSARVVACSAHQEGNDALVRWGAHAVCAKGAFAGIDAILRSLDPEQPSGFTLEPAPTTAEVATARGSEVCSAISTERWVGSVVCVVRDLRLEEVTPGTEGVTGVLDRFVGEVGLAGLGEDWVELSRGEAELVLHRVLTKDLAYGSAVVDDARARELTEQFLAQFDVDAEFFTNGPLGLGGSSWHPISTATFDTGIVCVDAHRVGIAWVQDED